MGLLVEESLVKDEAENLGLGVGREELMDLHFGANPSPIIKTTVYGSYDWSG